MIDSDTPLRNVSVLIPARNEEATIERVVKECTDWCSRVLVVDDQSTDNTPALAMKAGAHVVRHRVNMGYGAALNTGIRHCVAYGAQTIITLDGDGVHSGSEAKKLALTHILSSSGLTLGSRFMHHSTDDSRIPSGKLDANSLATSLFNLCFNSRITDVMTGLRAISTRQLDELPTSEQYDWTPALLLRMLRQGAKVVEHPIAVCYSAEELWATKRTEIADYAEWLSVNCRTQCQEVLQELNQKLRDFSLFRVQVVDRLYVCHPLASAGMYLIQEQEPHLRSESSCPPILIFVR